MIYKEILSRRNFTSLNFAFNLVRAIFALTTIFILCFNYTGIEDMVLANKNPYNLLFLKYDVFYIFNFRLAFWLSIIILLLSIAGYLPCIIIPLHFYVQASVIMHFRCLSDGGDFIATTILFLLLIPALTDTRINSWRDYQPTFFYNSFQKISVYLNYKAIRILICAIYFHAAVSKFEINEWYNGTAIYYFLNDPLSGNLEILGNEYVRAFIGSPIGITILGWGTLLNEVFLALVVFAENTKLKKTAFITGTIMHLLIAPLFYIPTFSIRMITCLFFYLLVTPREEEIPVLKLV